MCLTSKLLVEMGKQSASAVAQSAMLYQLSFIWNIRGQICGLHPPT